MEKLNGDRTKMSIAYSGMQYNTFKKFFDAHYEGNIEPHLKALDIKKPKKNRKEGDD